MRSPKQLPQTTNISVARKTVLSIRYAAEPEFYLTTKYLSLLNYTRFTRTKYLK